MQITRSKDVKTQHPAIGKGESKIRLFETNEKEAIGSPHTS